MIEINHKLKVRPGAYKIQAKGQLRLPFDDRQKSRLKTQLVSGEEIALKLPRGEILRGGDLVVASDGRVIEVIAQPEKLMHITCSDATALARAAFHLGNRHVPVQIGEGFLRIAADHVLEDMLRGLNAKLVAIEAAFEPEAGAYGGAHQHGDEHEGAGRIHEYGEHVHDEHCGHDHSHDHKHGHDHKHEHKVEHKHSPKHDHDHDHGHKHGHDHDHKHGDDHKHK
jgi:urease accessory protein